MTAKKLTHIEGNETLHWVGDGFPVRNLFSYHEEGAEISPFLLLDYAGPAEFKPAEMPRGVGKHPHRGFETVTIVYQGEVEHRDTAGNSGKIGPGDVQWMTAARGVLHEEMHSRAFTEKGGMLEMVQLWVNLPAKDKMSAPAYQAILNDQIPLVNLPNQAGTLKVIAGEYARVTGAARTFTPVNLWDLQVHQNKQLHLSVPAGFTCIILLRRGKLDLEKGAVLNPAELAFFDRQGTELTFTAVEESALLIMSGEPIHEPIAGHGPFVMNTAAEIRQAMEDYQLGRF